MRTQRIVIVGGGVVGSSIAWHLARAGAASDVVVIEPDPIYAHAATPRVLGTRSEILDRTALESRFPAIRIDDVDAALHSPDDGWIDRNGALQGFRKMARHLGVAYVEDRVVDFDVSGRRARSVGLASGERLEADIVVNCANCHAPQVCAMVGMPVDIVPMRRLTFYFDVQSPLAPLPLIRDHNAISVRPEGAGYICGVFNPDEPPGFNWEVDHAWFDDVVWPRIAFQRSKHSRPGEAGRVTTTCIAWTRIRSSAGGLEGRKTSTSRQGSRDTGCSTHRRSDAASPSCSCTGSTSRLISAGSLING